PLFHYQPYELALSTKVVDMVKKHEIELLHVHYAIPHAYAGYMAKNMLKHEGINIPVVTTLHGTDITLVGSHPSYKAAVEFSINKSDAVTAVSESLKRDTEELFSIDTNIEVIPNFINLEKYPLERKEKTRSIVAENDEKVICHISNFREVKRIDDVINIFHNINKKIPSKLMMVGEGPEKANAEKLCKKLKIKDNVFFFGNTNETINILTFSDLFLLPSSTESFGLAALEAMASFVPVISTNAGGLPEVNINGVSGYMSNVGDIDDMVNNSLKILSNHKVNNEFKENARKQAEKYNIHKIVPFYESIYIAAMNKVNKQ
ncbi:MAG: N-acetyl-alpha-D-glucosaminyl L-malate synthase BshA, partial [Flavobacteriaceae bacterium]|nr:N-acetyl-alpha-D-glucosaminyl L-malate synthase BshA [Flavobacteriaceae bacterium]